VAVVKLLPPAVADLQRLVAFLRDEDPQAAAETVRIILDALRVLERYPLIGRSIERERRELVIYRGVMCYLAQYQHEPVGDEVLIVALRHPREMDITATAR
jgi:plasmid stabilization system protein ParE